MNVLSTLQHMNIPTDSPNRAIQVVRGRLQRAPSESVGAQTFIKQLLEVDVSFNNTDKARIASFAVVQEVIRLGGVVPDTQAVIDLALAKAEQFVGNVDNAWLFVKGNVEPGEAQEAVIDGISTTVTVKSDGKIKRGGAKILALEMYKREAAKSPDGKVDSGAFAKMLMSELNMSLVGARTYTYNSKTAYLAELGTK